MSNFHPDTSGWRWSLVEVRLFSRAVGREGNFKQISLVCAGSTRSISATWVCPCSQHVCFPCLHCSGSRLLYRERALSCVHFPGLSRSGSGFWVLHKDADWVGPAFCAFPDWSNSGSQELDEHTLPRCRAPYPLCGPTLSFCAGPVHLVSLLGS